MYTYDWFSNNIPHWTALLSKLKGQDNLCFLEIGCFEGKATRWLLDNVMTGKNNIIECVDTFQGSVEHHDRGLDMSNTEKNFIENMGADLGNGGRVTKIKEYSQVWMRANFIPNYYDFIYIDGSHEAPDVLEDAILAFRMLKKGGIMIFDDFEWTAYPENPERNPKLAIESFLSVFRGKFILLHKQYQVAIEKT